MRYMDKRTNTQKRSKEKIKAHKASQKCVKREYKVPESTTDSSNDESKDEDEIEQSSKNEWCDLESENF